MAQTRRRFLVSAGALGLAPLQPVTAPASAQQNGSTPETAAQILSLFDPLPGRKAVKIWAPATAEAREFLVESDASERLFVGSAIKAFILCERLRQLDAPNVVQQLQQNLLALDASVWSPDSQIFNPPNLSGHVTERTALEAMIIHSDNTATDMELKQAGSDNVRSFISSIGLTSARIPDSTRVFFGYLLGAPDYKDFTWEQVVAAPDDAPIVNPPLNEVETLASSADDFVSFYSRALQGEFFKNPETLQEFRRILALGDVIYLIPIPLGINAFAKGGSIDVPGHHALCVAGGMFLSNRWAYYCLIINWEAPAVADPETVNAYVAAVRQAFTLTQNILSA
jgi:beta-lactamase class A